MENWRVERLQELPSAQDFASQAVSRNIPLVLESSIKDWPAYSKWHPAMGGLHYLKGIASGETVQAMLSSSSSFYGDIRSHERVALSFGDYLDYALHVYTELGGPAEENRFTENDTLNKCHDFPEGSRLYLAQAPMFNKDQQEHAPLRALMADITMPSCLISSSVTNVNLWMSASESKSSTHYDPYHNFLCVVVGQKQVTLWPPCATPYLYPYPVYGEASNHSSVDFMKPNEEMHPLFSHAMKLCQVVMLQAGDALFIPEGWYHQVNSESLTIAVNLWWPSVVALAMNSHMDGYYLRRIVSSLVDKEKQNVVHMASSDQITREPVNNAGVTEHESSVKLNVTEANVKQVEVIMHSSSLDDKQEGSHTVWKEKKDAFELLTPVQKKCLQSLVVACIGLENAQDSKISGEVKGEVSVALCPQQRSNKMLMFSMQGDDRVAQVFSILDPLALKQVLLVMVNHFPRTLEVLVCNKLSPLAAELLTSKFDAMDRVFSEIEQGIFYNAFYSVFEDPKLAMSTLLDQKEVFSASALKSVLEGYLGV